MMMDRELRTRDFAAAEAFFGGGETADDLAERLKECHPDRVIWYCPQKLSREVALRLHDRGISIIGVSDSGFPGVPCHYEIRRETALTKIVSEWKKEAITSVKVAVGPARSPADELRVGRTLEDLGFGIKFVSLGSQTLRHFVDCLARGPKFGIVLLHSAASLLAMGAPEALARLAKCSRLAFVDGPVSVPFTKLTDATVDLVTVDWMTVAKRIVDDLSTPRFRAFDPPFLFAATALFRVPLSGYSQRL